MKAKLKPENLIIYDETLVETTDTALDSLEYSGDFKKKILIITHTIPPESEEQILLNKMLTATGLSLSDIYHIQLDKATPLLGLISKLQPTNIISFGGYLNSPSISFSNKLYKVSLINDIQILMINKLDKIVIENELKQALWNALKKMFNL